jgi:hypothetical protein
MRVWMGRRVERGAQRADAPVHHVGRRGAKTPEKPPRSRASSAALRGVTAGALTGRSASTVLVGSIT